MTEYILTDPAIIDCLVGAVGMQSTAGLILTVVGIETPSFSEYEEEDTKKQEFTLERLSVYKKLVGLFVESEDQEVRRNIQTIIQSLVKVCHKANGGETIV